MDNKIYEPQNIIDENDFINRKTKVYAKINDSFYISTLYNIPEEVVMTNDNIQFFQFVRIKKVGEKMFEEKIISPRYVLANKVMNASEFTETIGMGTGVEDMLQEYVCNFGDCQVAVKELELEDESKAMIVNKIEQGDQLIIRPKTLGKSLN